MPEQRADLSEVCTFVRGQAALGGDASACSFLRHRQRRSSPKQAESCPCATRAGKAVPRHVARGPVLEPWAERATGRCRSPCSCRTRPRACGASGSSGSRAPALLSHQSRRISLARRSRSSNRSKRSSKRNIVERRRLTPTSVSTRDQLVASKTWRPSRTGREDLEGRQDRIKELGGPVGTPRRSGGPGSARQGAGSLLAVERQPPARGKKAAAEARQPRLDG